MRAIIIEQFGGPEKLVIQTLPDPEPAPGNVVVEVKAFGINHAETHMRKGEWAEAAKVSGIECVGIVKACPDGEFAVGQKVAAFMGGMGRSINGSYAEYTRVPLANVVGFDSQLPRNWRRFPSPIPRHGPASTGTSNLSAARRFCYAGQPRRSARRH